jgi:hypothetical protein
MLLPEMNSSLKPEMIRKGQRVDSSLQQTMNNGGAVLLLNDKKSFFHSISNSTYIDSLLHAPLNSVDSLKTPLNSIKIIRKKANKPSKKKAMSRITVLSAMWDIVFLPGDHNEQFIHSIGHFST